FPGVTALISPASLITQFNANPHLPLISLTCSPYHFRSSAVILGDAAHAMVPFYGQGMNAGLEDVRVLFDLLPLSTPTPESLDRYTALRAPDAAAISALALANYVEMREGVVSPIYKLRKRLEEALSHYFPSLGWATQYSRVSFGNMRGGRVDGQGGSEVLYAGCVGDGMWAGLPGVEVRGADRIDADLDWRLLVFVFESLKALRFGERGNFIFEPFKYYSIHI
ncbi:hypothetical protein V502_09927, partial [Pseudogymnoascus sp. VKM F-4520 (FW-2644)]